MNKTCAQAIHNVFFLTNYFNLQNGFTFLASPILESIPCIKQMERLINSNLRDVMRFTCAFNIATWLVNDKYIHAKLYVYRIRKKKKSIFTYTIYNEGPIFSTIY